MGQFGQIHSQQPLGMLGMTLPDGSQLQKPTDAGADDFIADCHVQQAEEGSDRYAFLEVARALAGRVLAQTCELQGEVLRMQVKDVESENAELKQLKKKLVVLQQQKRAALPITKVRAGIRSERIRSTTPMQRAMNAAELKRMSIHAEEQTSGKGLAIITGDEDASSIGGRTKGKKSKPRLEPK